MPVQTFLPGETFQSLLDGLQERAFRCIGPQVEQGAIVYRPLERVGQLPQGIGDDQQPGHYRLVRHGHRRLFAWANGPQALKPALFASREALWSVTRTAEGRLDFREQLPAAAATAVIGARACDLAALAIHDRHFAGDPHYRARRAGLFVVAVNCSHPAPTCFCASTGDGPGPGAGFDILLDELEEGFVAQAGSTRGQALLDDLALAPATPEQVSVAGEQLTNAAAAQRRALPSRNLAGALLANPDHPRWQAVAERCLACGNCTQVCPTCFCHEHVEEPTLDGGSSTHYRVWDSCFTEGHSYIHGIVIRSETAQRYRQWLTHKLDSWHEQFGRSGCVGCGRCITWCPVGIDVTEEAQAICAGEGA